MNTFVYLSFFNFCLISMVYLSLVLTEFLSIFLLIFLYIVFTLRQ